MSIHALLLAAGESSRMGEPKALLPWQGSTLIEFQIHQLLAGGIERVAVVLGHDAGAILHAVRPPPQTTIVVNERHATGKTSSVKAGMEAIPPHVEAILLLAVDQPRPASLIRRLIQTHRAADALITVPAFQGRHGHPAIFARPLFPEIRAIDEESHGLRAIRRRHTRDTHVCDTTSPVCLIDINTPEDYRAALALFASQSPEDHGKVG